MTPLGNKASWPRSDSKLMWGNTHAAIFLLACGSVSCLLGEVGAAAITAKSVSFADVSAAIASAKDGDTVTVPAGTATWTSCLNVDKHLTLQGAGAGSTVIIDEVVSNAGPARKAMRQANHPAREQVRRGAGLKIRGATVPKGRNAPQVRRGKQGNCLISVALRKELPFRMTGFTFKGSTNNAPKGPKARIQLSGNSHAFRIDHCTFDRLQGLNVSFRGSLWGVIDHCQFNLAKVQPIQVYHATWNGGDHGHGSWADDAHWGSEKFVFIEDNVFDNAMGFRRSIDAYQGARLVVRYNQFHNSGLVLHGTEGQGRGARAVEEYNNIYRNDRPVSAGQIRSGSIITHDNKWSNVAKGHVLQVYRQFRGSPHWGWSNGQNPYDDNASNGATGYWETGKHTGPSGATVLSDSTKNWAPNQWYQPGATYIVRNITKEAAGDFNQSFAIANTANTITCSSLDGVKLTFNTTDTYQIWKVLHSLDQPGLGKGDLLRGLPGRPAKWPHQITEPCYSWNNAALEDGTPRNLASTEPSIKEGRDFFNGTAKPDYRPYTYPHPLVSGSPAPVAHTAADRRTTTDTISSNK